MSPSREARFFSKHEGDKLVCGLCPNFCGLAPGECGICRVRKNVGGRLVLPFYGKTTSLAVDPIEKKPLYHFKPGSEILSVGFLGCNLHCPFCQNFQISQGTEAPAEFLSPENLVRAAKNYGSFGIAYTYSEPLVHIEYLLEAAKLAREEGLSNVLVSNGCLNPGPAMELLPLIDAANIDLKSFSEDFYRNELGGSLKAVLGFLKLAAESTHLEVTTLVIPGKNDSPGEIEEIASFIAEISPDIPLHLSAYRPMYKYSVRATFPEEILSLAEVARRKLNYVYGGNIRSVEATTTCPSCRNILIKRRGYSIELIGLSGENCESCGARINIVL